MKSFIVLLTVLAVCHCKSVNEVNVKKVNAPIEASAVCDPPFVRVGNECYFFSKTGATWFDALQYCKEMHADLVSFNDAGHFKYNLIKSHIKKHPSLKDHVYWTSGTDAAEEGYWMWHTAEQPIDLNDRHWCVDKPSRGENRCLLTNYGPKNCWYPFDCEEEALGASPVYYICELLIE